MKHIQQIILTMLFISIIFIPQSSAVNNNSSQQKKIGILLVNHGSRSETWRKALLSLEESVRPELKKNKNIHGIKTAFMEYTEPSIATRLKEFDAEGYTDIVLVPTFLTVSEHTFDDIPTIIGQKIDPNSLETLRIEKIERYTPKASVIITPKLDFTDILEKNILKRTEKLSKIPSTEGIVMIAYGDATYDKEWRKLLDKIGTYIQSKLGITEYSYGWCGHIAHYNPNYTTEAIQKVLSKKEIAIVIPVLVAHDEMFQIQIIGDGINAVPNYRTRVRYKPDSILPDKNITDWMIGIINEHVSTILKRGMVSK